MLLRARRSIGKAVAIGQKMSRFAGIMGSNSMEAVVMLVIRAHFRALRILVAHRIVTVVTTSLHILSAFK